MRQPADQLVYPICPVDTVKQMRKTPVDRDNKPLCDITEDLAKHFRELLCAAVWPPWPSRDGLMSDDASLTFMCAHDSLTDCDTKTKISPHLVADCTALCNLVADATLTSRLGELEKRDYAAEATACRKTVTTAKKTLKKLKAKASKARKKANAAVAQVKELGDKADDGLKAAAQTHMAQLQKAEAVVREAKMKVEEAQKSTQEVVKKAEAKAEMIAVIKANIVKCWCAVVNTLTAPDSYFGDNPGGLKYVERCQIYMPSSKGRIFHCN